MIIKKEEKIACNTYLSWVACLYEYLRNVLFNACVKGYNNHRIVYSQISSISYLSVTWELKQIFIICHKRLYKHIAFVLKVSTLLKSLNLKIIVFG